jgi:hypothetical protein
MSRRTSVGAGISLGALAVLPATAQADDIKVTNLNDDGAGSLRQALEDANADADLDRILFKSKLSGTIELTGVDLDIYRSLEIVGPGARRLAITREGTLQQPIFQVFTTNATPVGVTISGIAVTNTETKYNGAIGMYSYAGPMDLTLSRVTISGNTATGSQAPSLYGDGGGVTAKSDGLGDLTIENSTVSGNRAAQGHLGGGIFSRNVDVSIRSSTISGNGGVHDGGGVYVLADGATPSFSVRNSTVTGNNAYGSAAGGGLSEGGLPVSTLRGSIVAGNHDIDDAAPDIDDGPWNVSFSLIGDTSGAGITDEDGNLLGVDPKLKPLHNNGGPTNTHAFKKSPAKNKVPKNQSENKDQRGAKRKGKGDIGAYELVKCEGVIVNRVGTGKNDKLKGTKKKDGILGLGGNDKLSGKKGKDGLCGGKAEDKLKGGPGKDKLDGGPGKDKLDGGPGKDKEVQ